jgi:dTDP-4-dehydrorhamnose 3,5-epimerase
VIGTRAAADGATALTVASVRGTLPAGVRALELTRHAHERGSLTELFREDWWPHGPARQWNLVTSPAGVLRGIHVHRCSAEYYALLSGRALVGYRDVRPESPTFGATAVVEIDAAEPVALVTPSGLAHGVYSLDAITLLVGTTGSRDAESEAGCHWRDPELGIPWPFETAIVSAQDAALGRLSNLLDDGRRA